MSDNEREAMKIYSDRRISKTDDLSKMNKRIEKLNHLYAREPFHVDEHGNLVITDGTQRICNFFVYPTHKLYYDDGNSLEMIGVGIYAFAKIDEETYKKVCLNLKFDMIENGDWVKSELLDTDYDLNKSTLYPILRSALKIATRKIGKRDVKIFNGEVWIEDEEAVDLLGEYQDYFEAKRIWGDIKQPGRLKEDVAYFLNAVMIFTKENVVTPYGEKPQVEENHAGWENNEMYFLWGKKLWDWVRKRSASEGYEFVSETNAITVFLMEAEIIRFDKEKSGRIRVDTWETVYSGFKKKFYALNKSKMLEFLSDT